MHDHAPAIPNILAIAGSDPSGGAGIQADIKAISACAGYAMAAITALTAQNTRGVTGVHPVPAPFVRAQIDAVFDDIRVDAVKVGMVATPEIACAVADAIEHHRPPFVVIDPVAFAKSGDRLLGHDAEAALRERIVPLADLLTPNLHEAAALLGVALPSTPQSQEHAAAELLKLGARAVLVKGGHEPEDDPRPTSDDVLAEANNLRWFSGPRVQTRCTHGAGCTLSSAIAALRPRTADLSEAVRKAKAFVSRSLEHASALSVGVGRGPLHHFHALHAGSDTQIGTKTE